MALTTDDAAAACAAAARVASRATVALLLLTVACGGEPMESAGARDAGTDAGVDPAIRAEWDKWRRYADEHCNIDSVRIGDELEHPSEPDVRHLLLMTDFRDEHRIRVVILTERWQSEGVRPWVGEATADPGRERDYDPFQGYSRVEICQQPEGEWGDCLAGTMEMFHDEPRRPGDLMILHMNLRSEWGRMDFDETLYPCTPYTDP